MNDRNLTQVQRRILTQLATSGRPVMSRSELGMTTASMWALVRRGLIENYQPHVYDITLTADGRVEAFLARARYLTGIPRKMPEGRVLVHNFPPGYPGRRAGEGGFRFWTEPPNDRLNRCGCGWASRIRAHYCYRDTS